MTKEQIKNEAVEYAKGKYGGENAKMWAIAQIHAGRDGFIAGADWRINSVWHKPEEVPENDRLLLVNCTSPLFRFTYVVIGPTTDRFEEFVSCYGITHWAYINDLTPTEDECNS